MLPYNVARVLNFFNRRITAYDLVVGIVDYKATFVKTPIYHFTGVIIPPTDKDLNFYEEGEISQGTMTLYVKNNVKLYMCDSMDVMNPNCRQTIIVFDGDEYRIRALSNRSEDGLHRKYVMSRYVEGRI